MTEPKPVAPQPKATPLVSTFEPDCFLVYLYPPWRVHQTAALSVRHAELWVSATDRNGGCVWEFIVAEHVFHTGEASTHVEIMNDAYQAFAQIPEFFAALAAEHPTTLPPVAQILARLGAVDLTYTLASTS